MNSYSTTDSYSPVYNMEVLDAGRPISVYALSLGSADFISM